MLVHISSGRNDKVSLNSKDAVDTFFRSTREAFGFLEEPGAVHSQELEVFDSRAGHTVLQENFKGDSFFLAEVRYAGQGWHVRVTYGDREYLINTIVAVTPARRPVHSGSIWRRLLTRAGRRPTNASFALWEWIQALEGGDSTPAEHAGGATTSAEVDRVVRRMGDALNAHFHTIRSNAGVLGEQVRQRRERRMRGWEEESLANRHRYAAAQAADAFRRKDYARVVALLEPLEARLTPAQRKKMQFARDRLAGGSKQ